MNAEFQRIARRDKKAFLRDQCKDRLNKSCYPYPCFPLNKEVALLWAFYLKKINYTNIYKKKKKKKFLKNNIGNCIGLLPVYVFCSIYPFGGYLEK